MLTDPGTCAAALNRLAHSGQVIYDLVAGVYRWRQVMPMAVGEAEMGPENQELAQAHGFRPAISNVPLDEELFNPLNGVQYEINVPVLKPPKGEVMEAMFTAWVRVRNTGL